MKSVLRKWGNSVGIRIPKAIRQALNLKDGDTLSMSCRAGKLIMEKINKNTVLIDCLDCESEMKSLGTVNGLYHYKCPECLSEIKTNKIRHVR
jgi:antitoxin MazE